MSYEDTEHGRWIASCGTCDGETRIKNAGWRFDYPKGPCDTCTTDPMWLVEDHGRVVTQLGWCECGNPEDMDRMMLAYLTNLHERATTRKGEGPPHFGYRPTPDLSPDAEMLIQYVADSLDWTEHGGSVGGAWLSDDGREALAHLTAGDQLSGPLHSGTE